ncbi:alpha/beta hydrolase [Candidatus Sodalis endolongispinus]|uniref:Alpha/beta hydrolase n=1 Tax=Candidatus Sodalis endolongispinus TaxID=2812662 RepID=A0ABS5YEZ7_9GAMM|nr:alpha/beta hydrolase [Candidatus Sodalis endolongispinus]MBT9433512.1 alpha/beta hydrolase [Candidatus Sodalis endolongispinus]
MSTASLNDVRRAEAEPDSHPDATQPGFSHHFATVNGLRWHYLRGGRPDGDPLVLLAGFPQSGCAWRKMLPLLAGHFDLWLPDLPGQGDSDLPADGYDTQTTARRLHDFLQQQKVGPCYLAAHDVGAWVAFPYAMMFGSAVKGLALLDAGIPGITLPEALPIAPEQAWRTWHFAFHALDDLPESLITGRERVYLTWFLRRKAANPQSFSEADIDEYLRTFSRPGALHAGLAWYRAATLSAEQNRRLCAAGPLTPPLLALSADHGSMADMAAPLRAFARQVSGVVIPHSGHFLPDEQPAAVAQALISFLCGSASG